MGRERVVVVGAGIGGLVAALDLAVRGVDVTVVEQAAGVGGKMREVAAGPLAMDAGPTVFTMREVFEELFADAGTTLAEHVRLRPAAILARHAWGPDQCLDLHADRERSADAIAAFAGPAEARGFLEFSDRAARVYRTLEQAFIRAPRPGLLGLTRAAGPWQLRHISPFTTLWNALGRHFRDPRLRQLFGRYATYCGSSPFLAPATLMLVAHVESAGVWLVEGGMHRLAEALAALAAARGARLRLRTAVVGIPVEQGAVRGVVLETGERIAADAVLLNADVTALARGRFGPIGAAVAPVGRAQRSLSAVTWNLRAQAAGFPLLRHTVFFSRDYAAEFDDILRRRRLPHSPTAYVCAQDRDDLDGASVPQAERLLCLVNAPADGDIRAFAPEEIESCRHRTFQLLAHCGLELMPQAGEPMTVTAPDDFERMFPATGGALYGRASHGWAASFRRPGARCAIPGLYLAGGSVHPGPGVPMAALSGRIAAASLLADFASTASSRRAATSGGTSTHSTPTGSAASR